MTDAKDEARQAEVRTDIAQALLTIDRRINRSAWRTVGFTVATMFAIAGSLVGARARAGLPSEGPAPAVVRVNVYASVSVPACSQAAIAAALAGNVAVLGPSGPWQGTSLFASDRTVTVLAES